MGLQFNENEIITWEVVSYENICYSHNAIEFTLNSAFAVWTAFINLNFIQRKTLGFNNTNYRNIEIKFVAGNHSKCESFDGKSGVLAHSTPYYSFSNLLIHFDSDEDWIFNEKTASIFEKYYSGRPIFFNVAVHEIGHVLGLKHPPHLSGSVMNTYYNPFFDTPTKSEVLFLQKKYGIKPNSILPSDNNIVISFIKEYYNQITIFLIVVLVFSVTMKTTLFISNRVYNKKSVQPLPIYQLTSINSLYNPVYRPTTMPRYT
ncbi:zinc-dependent metalloprotease [Dasineura jujubifolia toursvirus 2a]|nr:zinc-dependent metalloprotease [Dasineura jujubifolia toursvirus 2a]